MLKCSQAKINNIQPLRLKTMDPIKEIDIIKIILIQTDRHIKMLPLSYKIFKVLEINRKTEEDIKEKG